jgi:tetratricopeptide (TPR) repeat protein
LKPWCVFYPKLVGLSLLIASSISGQRVTPDLVEAISQIERGDFRGAADRLGTQSDDAERLFVRDIALTLAEDFGMAVPTLERATKLNPQREEYNLWLYAAEVMSDMVTDQHAYRIRPVGQPKRLEGTPRTRNQAFPQDYGDYIFRSMATPYRIAIQSGEDVRAPKVRTLLLEGGRQFAQVRWMQPEIAGVNRQRAEQASANGKPGEALMAVMREHDYSNPDWQARFCKALVLPGRNDSGRAACTYAIQLNPQVVNAWLYRAYAGAPLGSEKRARADFAHVERADPKLAQQTRGNFEKLLAPSAVVPAQALAALDRAARAGRPLAELQRLAQDVHYSVNARRLRLDESYVERAATFESAAISGANALAYARFLLEEFNIDERSESVERVNEPVVFRQGVDQQAESQKALVLTELALRSNPRNAGAMATRAQVLDRLGRSREAETQIDAAIGIAGKDPAALVLYSEYPLSKRDLNYMAAASSRTPVEIARQARTEQRSDGEYRVTDRTMRNPGAGDYREANGLDRSGDQLSEGAKQSFLQARAFGRSDAALPTGT